MIGLSHKIQLCLLDKLCLKLDTSVSHATLLSQFLSALGFARALLILTHLHFLIPVVQILSLFAYSFTMSRGSLNESQ